MKCPRLLVFVLVVGAACSGCSKNDKTIVGPPPPDTTLAEATQTLEDILFTQMNSTTDPQRPTDINFTSAYVRFNAVLRQHPNNLTAHLESRCWAWWP